MSVVPAAAFALALLFTVASEAASVVLAAGDPRVHYTGRFDHSSTVGSAAFSWPATQISCTFTGSSQISARFTAAALGATLRIIINGNTTGFVVIGGNSGDDDSGAGGSKVYTLATGLAPAQTR